MKKRYLYYNKTSLLLVLLILLMIGFISFPVMADDIGSVTCTVSVEITVCGNNTREGSEQCDGTDLAGEDCVSRGFAGGTLSCYAVGTANECTFDTSGCTTGGGGGGGGGYIPPLLPLITKVVIQGKAYPLSLVTILKDGKVITTTVPDSQANFKVEITDITPGVWTFGVWAEDKQGRKSITFNFTTNVMSEMITTISGIFLPPTIELEETSLQRGETLNILGQTAPKSDISIFVSSDEIIKKTVAEADGTWFYSFDTTILEEGSHATRVKATLPEGLFSTFSNSLAFYLGKEAPGIPGVVCPRADLNTDGKTNLIDFSILLYWWGKYDTCADQNADGKINLIDFSIMLYYWTG